MFSLPRTVGPFTLQRRLPSTTAAERFLGRVDQRGDDWVVVRRVPPASIQEPGRLEATEARVRDLCGVRHPFLTQVQDWVCDGAERFVVESHFEGIDLERVLRAAQSTGQGLPPNVFLNLATLICNALEAMHGRPAQASGAPHVLHLALAPAAVLITREGKVVLGEYGLVRAPTLTAAGGAAAGAPRLEYLSPEQTMPDEELSPASDIFALGAMLYEMATGEPLFRGATPLQTIHNIRRAEVADKLEALRPTLPGLDKVLARALARNPRYRYNRAFVLREDLRGLMAGYSFNTIADDTRRFVAPLFILADELGADDGAAPPAHTASEDGEPRTFALDAFDDEPGPVIDPVPPPPLPPAPPVAPPRAPAPTVGDAEPAPHGQGARADLYLDPPGAVPTRAFDLPPVPPLPAAELPPEPRRAASLLPALAVGAAPPVAPPLPGLPPAPLPPPRWAERTAPALADAADLPEPENTVPAPVELPEPEPDPEHVHGFAAVLPPAAALPDVVRAPLAALAPPLRPDPSRVPPVTEDAGSISLPLDGSNDDNDHAAPVSLRVEPPRPAPSPLRAVAPAAEGRASAPRPGASTHTGLGGLLTVASVAAALMLVVLAGVLWARRSPAPASDDAALAAADVSAAAVVPSAAVGGADADAPMGAGEEGPLPIDNTDAGDAAEAPPSTAADAPAALDPDGVPTAPSVDAVAAVEPDMGAAGARAERDGQSAAPSQPPPQQRAGSVPTSSPSAAATASAAASSAGPSSASAPPSATARAEAETRRARTASASTPPAAPVAIDLDRLGKAAAAGKLSPAEVASIEGIGQADARFSRSRSVLAMDARQKRASAAEKRYLDELMSLPENRYDPLVLIDVARFDLNSKQYARAYERASAAERQWQRIPPALMAEKKAQIFELEAKASKGLMLGAADEARQRELCQQAIRYWQRYAQHVAGRPEQVAVAQRELAALEDIRARLD